jgi:parallel beta-helix repeat protein
MENTKKMVLTLLIPLIFTFFIAHHTSADRNANTIYVGGTGTGNYSTIQDGLNHAQVNDIVYVYQGVYKENIRLHRPVSLIGENKHATIISGRPNRDIIFITADSCTIRGFTVRNSSDPSYSGVNVQSEENIIVNNIIENNSGWGLYLYYSSNNVIVNNTFLNDGINIVGSLSNWDTHTIKNNTVNGKELYYYKNRANKTIIGEAGQIILANCSNFTIRQVVISKVDQGIVLGYTSNSSVIHNSVFDSKVGIRLQYAFGNKIRGNSVLNNEYGIYVTHSNDNEIAQNNVSLNRAVGCFICCKSANNVIYLNHFYQNNKSALDLFENRWYHNETGNYWSDYDGLDKNNDGIGDTPYTNISSDGRNQDLYPLGYFSNSGGDVNKIFGFDIVVVIFIIVAFVFWIKRR